MPSFQGTEMMENYARFEYLKYACYYFYKQHTRIEQKMKGEIQNIREKKIDSPIRCVSSNLSWRTRLLLQNKIVSRVIIIHKPVDIWGIMSSTVNKTKN